MMSRPESDDADRPDTALTDAVLESVTRRQLREPHAAPDDQGVRLWALVRRDLIPSDARDGLRRHTVAAVEGPGRMPAPRPRAEAADTARWWLVALRPRTLPATLLQRQPARRAAPGLVPATLDAPVMLHDLFVGAEMSEAVTALITALRRPEVWDGYDMTVTTVCRDGREIYAAMNEDRHVLVERHKNVTPPTFSSYTDDGPEIPIAVFHQDLTTAVLRRLVRRPGANWEGSADVELSYLSRATAVVWLHRMHVHAQSAGPIGRSTAMDLCPPALTHALGELKRPSQIGADTDVDYAPIWDLLWLMLENQEALVPGMQAADGAWRDPGVLVQRLNLWAGDPASIVRTPECRRWFKTAADASVIDETLRYLP